MLGAGIGVFPENQNGSRLHLGTEIDHADERVPGYAVAALLIFGRNRIKVEYDTHVSRSTGYRQTVHRIAERLFATGLPALQPVDIAKRYAPGSERFLQIADHRFERFERRLFGLGRRKHGSAILFFAPEEIQS